MTGELTWPDRKHRTNVEGQRSGRLREWSAQHTHSEVPPRVMGHATFWGKLCHLDISPVDTTFGEMIYKEYQELYIIFTISFFRWKSHLSPDCLQQTSHRHLWPSLQGLELLQVMTDQKPMRNEIILHRTREDVATS